MAMGNFVTTAAKKLHVGRIKLPAVLHDVIHSYTHFDKGFCSH